MSLIPLVAALLGVGAVGTLVWMWWAPRVHSHMRLAAAGRGRVRHHRPPHAREAGLVGLQ